MAKGLIVIDKERCKGCGLCVDVCPRKIIGLEDSFNKQGYCPVVLADPEKCTGCALCAIICPDAAIEVFREVKDGQKDADEG